MANQPKEHDANEEGFQQDLMEDFFLDFKDAHQHCENTLIDLEHAPTDTTLLNDLFRSVHTIKGNLIYVGLKDLTPLLQSLEDVLDLIRNEQTAFDSLLSDVILLAMDKTKQWVEAIINNDAAPFSKSGLLHLCQQISRIAEVSPAERQPITQSVIQIMAPNTALVETTPIPSLGAKHLAAQPETTELLKAHHIEVNDDMAFFLQLSAPLEQRSQFWQGRSARMLQLTLAMNQKAGNPVEPDQMAAAVFMHDIAMAFLPLDVLHKKSALSAEERGLLRAHTQQAFSLISGMKKWEQASYIVLEHHEKVDGTGYPAGIKGEHICPGAKILAIVDTFDARTHERAYSTQMKRPFVRAILEINRCAGTHFDPTWVEVFNEVARSLEQSN